MKVHALPSSGSSCVAKITACFWEKKDNKRVREEDRGREGERGGGERREREEREREKRELIYMFWNKIYMMQCQWLKLLPRGTD